LWIHDEADGKGMALGKGEELGQEEPATEVVICRRREIVGGDWIVGESERIQEGVIGRSMAHESGIGV